MMARNILAVAAMAFAFAGQAAFRLPAGFRAEAAAPPPLVRFPMFGSLDERGRLFVAESSGSDLYAELQKLTRRCRVSVLKDENGDGTYDASHVFADQLVFPMGLAWHEGKLFVADPPNLISLEDSDGDERADKRAILLSGFGHVDNGSLHGVVIGPDGWLYMTTGQPDGYQLQRADGSVLEGKSGALLRCRTDGSQVEVLARGFENLVEVVFLPGGEIIGTDNWFRLPQEGIRDALVHLVPGGVYPLNAHARTESGLFFSGELLPAVQLYPAVAHSGLMRYGGKAFPTEMRGNLFSAQFNTRKVARHQLRRSGATFQTQDHDFLSTDDPDFHPSDVLEDKDGSLLVVDTGSWYVQHCPTGRIRKTRAEGAIFRVRFDGKPGPHPPENADDQFALRARSVTSESEIMPLLRHSATPVRFAAAEALGRCGTRNAIPGIVDALAEADGDPFLTHALIHALHRAADSDALEEMLAHAHPEVRRAALVLLDQAPHRKLSAAAALGALKAANARLRAAAIAAIQRHRDWLPHIARYLREAIDQSLLDPALLRELVPVFPAPEIKEALLRGVRDEHRSNEARTVLLDIISRCRFESGEHEKLRAALRSALQSPDPAVIRHALRVPVKGLEEDYARVSGDPRLPAALRVECLRVLVSQRPALDDAAFALLLSSATPTNAGSLRLSAAEVVGAAKLSPAQFKSFLALVSEEPMVSPSLVFSAAQKCGYIDELLPYLRRSIRLGWQVPDDLRKWLEGSADGAELEAILAEAADRSEQQRKMLADFEPLLTGGDPNRGHQIYLGKAGCAACHRVGKYGSLVGPDLTRIGAIRAGLDILESLLIPSATIAQGYDLLEVELTDGESFSGIRVRQLDHSFLLRDASGAETRIDPKRVTQVHPSKTSMMPDGLLTTLSRDEARDLLAYLQALK